MVRRLRSLAEGATTPYDRQPRDPARVLGRTTAIFLIGAGVIHVSAAADHSGLPVIFAGFVIFAVLQVGLGALLIWRRPDRPLASFGLALSVASVLLWLASRTVGLELFGGGGPEQVGVKDGVTVIFELAAIPGLYSFAASAEGPERLPSPLRGRHAFELMAALAIALYVPALTIDDGHHGHGAFAELAGHVGLEGHSEGGGGEGHEGSGGHKSGSATGNHDSGGHGGGSEEHGTTNHAASATHSGHTLATATGTHGHGTVPVAAGTHGHTVPSTGTDTAHTGHPGTTGTGSGSHPSGHPPSAGGTGSHPGGGSHTPAPPAPAPQQPQPQPEPQPLEQIADEIDKLIPGRRR